MVRIPGNCDAPPLFLNAHLDTVEPGRGVEVTFEGGVFRSASDTILGGDDKAAVAILMELAQVLSQGEISHGPLELVFTVCEEIGLLGAKALDPSILRSRAGIALDSTGTYVLINKAPAAIRFQVRVVGRSAHAGIAPEAGINAIVLAAKALAHVNLGRIDPQTTANIGTIHGGAATNIVPEEVVIEGEVRSHDPQRLREVQDRVLALFHTQAAEARAAGKQDLPRVETKVTDDYPAMTVPEDHPVVEAVKRAAADRGRRLKIESTGGGSDANIFNGKGLATVILGIGMDKVHTTEESIKLADMVETAELVLETIENWSGQGSNR